MLKRLALSETITSISQNVRTHVVDCFDGKLNPDNVISKEVLAS
jgi:hypothetical protein